MFREQIIDAPRVGLANDSDADRLRSGGNPEPLWTARIPVEDAEAFSVERDLDRVVSADWRQAEEPAAGTTDSELVFGVEREDVAHQQTAASA